MMVNKINTIKTAKASLHWNLFVECPHCKHQNDLSDSPHDDDNYFSESIFNNRWEDCKGNEVTCESCGYEFTVSEIVY